MHKSLQPLPAPLLGPKAPPCAGWALGLLLPLWHPHTWLKPTFAYPPPQKPPHLCCAHVVPTLIISLRTVAVLHSWALNSPQTRQDTAGRPHQIKPSLRGLAIPCTPCHPAQGPCACYPPTPTLFWEPAYLLDGAYLILHTPPLFYFCQSPFHFVTCYILIYLTHSSLPKLEMAPKAGRSCHDCDPALRQHTTCRCSALFTASS
jgi:hypothetical protein